MKNKRLILYFIALLFIIVPIIYFGMNYVGSKKGLTTKKAVIEYNKEAGKLKLAPGWKWPKNPLPSKTPNGDKVRFEKGYATSHADAEWFCSWSSRALNINLSENEHQTAINNLLKIRSKYFYTNSLTAESKQGFDQMLQSVQKGNLTKLKNFVKYNCKGS